MNLMNLKRIVRSAVPFILAAALSACEAYVKDSESEILTPDTGIEDGTFTENISGDYTEGDASTQIQYDKEQVLNLFYEPPVTFDQNDSRGSGDFRVLSQIYEGLFRASTDENGNAVFSLAGAENYFVSDNGLEWTFIIRDNYWSDGVKVTAKHYADSILRLITPKNAFPNASAAFFILNAEKYYNGDAVSDDIGVLVKDDKTLVITLENAAFEPISRLAFPVFFPVRLDLIQKAADSGKLYSGDFSFHAFNGPFAVEKWEYGGNITLKKNSSYRDAENVLLETVNFIFVKDDTQKSDLFQNKTADFTDGNSETNGQIQESAVQLMRTNLPLVKFICFNQRNGGLSGLMKNEKIRKALSLSIDRFELAAACGSGKFEAGFGIYPKSVRESGLNRQFNEPLAAIYKNYGADDLKLMFKEGMSEEGVNGEPESVTLVFLVASWEEETAVLEHITGKWHEILGITVEIRIEDVANYRNERAGNRYDILNGSYNSFFAGYGDFAEIWETESRFNPFFGKYSSAEYDEIFASIKNETLSDEERAEIYAKLEEILTVRDFAVAPYGYGYSEAFVWGYVKNLCFLPSGMLDFSRAYILGK